MDIIITEEQRVNVINYLTKLLEVFNGGTPVTNSSTEPQQDLVWKTFDEWSNDGYRIVRGEKATKFDGINKFSENQVIRKQPNKSYNQSEQSEFSGSEEDVPF